MQKSVFPGNRWYQGQQIVYCLHWLSPMYMLAFQVFCGLPPTRFPLSFSSRIFPSPLHLPSFLWDAKTILISNTVFLTEFHELLSFLLWFHFWSYPSLLLLWFCGGFRTPFTFEFFRKRQVLLPYVNIGTRNVSYCRFLLTGAPTMLKRLIDFFLVFPNYEHIVRIKQFANCTGLTFITQGTFVVSVLLRLFPSAMKSCGLVKLPGVLYY